MLKEVYSERAEYNDDGWALLSVSKRLSAVKQDRKILIALSDGYPKESEKHAHISLEDAVKKVTDKADCYLIGLGLGSGTKHVESYYPNSIANISAKDLSSKLGALVKDVIEGVKG
jgi:cobalamin biosynthesis protein CobT